MENAPINFCKLQTVHVAVDRHLNQETRESNFGFIISIRMTERFKSNRDLCFSISKMCISRHAKFSEGLMLYGTNATQSKQPSNHKPIDINSIEILSEK